MKKETALTLLFVEDDVNVRERICKALGRTYSGARIHSAGDGAEGLEKFKEHHPDIIITDINMPVMDGAQMAKEIKALDEEAIVIAVTAYSDTEYLLKAIDTGISHYILKPVSYDKLFAAIDKCIDLIILKRRVREQEAARSAELEATNRELEAFSYTVAHDLRKPLTVINGYCQILTEVCSEKLDEQCKAYLKEIYKGALGMNNLITALLDFSRLSHAEPRRKIVYICGIGEAVASELKLAEPERQVTFRITTGMFAEVDPDLIRVVLSNLFGNAWKFTSHREEGIIDFGETEINGKQTFFVKDNGIGFDPEEAGKLFTPFQRLKSSKEVGGLGIGLATVARIIHRHGGEVCAEGEPGKGATFYFTLQD